MAKRVVVEIQMKTIKRYSVQGFFVCLFLAFFIALPIIELFLPFGIVENYSYLPTASGSFTVIDIMKSVFKSDNGVLMQLFTSTIPPTAGTAAKFYNIFINALPTIFIVIVSVYFFQCVLAIWALILIIVFLVKGRWAHFNDPFFFSHFGLWTYFAVVLLGQGLIIFSTTMGCGGYTQMSNAYLVFPFPGWLYTIIYFGASLISFIVIFFINEYGLADRIYIGENKRPGEPNAIFFDKNNYLNNSKQPIPEQPKTEAPVAPEQEEIQKVEERKTVAPIEVNKEVPTEASATPVKKEEPEKDIPQNLTEIDDRKFSADQTLNVATIPQCIVEIGDSAFSNCLNLKTVNLHKGIQKIGSNCFFNCARLKSITYSGTKAEWKSVKRGSNWLTKAGTKVVRCSDGPVQVNPLH